MCANSRFRNAMHMFRQIANPVKNRWCSDDLCRECRALGSMCAKIIGYAVGARSTIKTSVRVYLRQINKHVVSKKLLEHITLDSERISVRLWPMHMLESRLV